MQVGKLLALVSIVTVVGVSGAHSQNSAVETVRPHQPTISSAAARVRLTPLYRFTGVRDGNAGAWAIATAVFCSNPTPAPVTIRLRMFGLSGTKYADVRYTVQPLYTHTAVSRAIATYPLNLNLNIPAISQGMGDIAVSDTRVTCAAQVIDALGAPPAFVSSLPMERNEP